MTGSFGIEKKDPLLVGGESSFILVLICVHGADNMCVVLVTA